eukprot:12626263-Alexandrium_andersonii.AAC.1
MCRDTAEEASTGDKRAGLCERAKGQRNGRAGDRLAARPGRVRLKTSKLAEKHDLCWSDAPRTRAAKRVMRASEQASKHHGNSRCAGSARRACTSWSSARRTGRRAPRRCPECASRA